MKWLEILFFRVMWGRWPAAARPSFHSMPTPTEPFYPTDPDFDDEDDAA